MTPYYEQDGITIYHGDCREILPHLPKVDLVLTDPPAVSKYYSGGEPKSLRGEVELSAGDILGIDYYALMIPPMVNGRPLLPAEFYQTFADTISKGYVVILQVQ